MKEFFFLNDCSSYGSHWLWCIVFLKKSGVHKFWFFDTSGNLEEDITKLNNKLKMKNTCHMLLQQMTWCTQQKCTKHISTWEVPENWQQIILWYKVWFRAVGVGKKGARPDCPQYFGRSVHHIPTRGQAGYAHHAITCPPDFQTFLRPCDLFVIHSSVR